MVYLLLYEVDTNVAESTIVISDISTKLEQGSIWEVCVLITIYGKFFEEVCVMRHSWFGWYASQHR